MIEIRNVDGRTHLVEPRIIERIDETAPSSAWHGIRSRVHLKGGEVLESSDEPRTISAAMERIMKERTDQLRVGLLLDSLDELRKEVVQALELLTEMEKRHD